MRVIHQNFLEMSPSCLPTEPSAPDSSQTVCPPLTSKWEIMRTEWCWDDPVRLGWRPEPALRCQQPAFLILTGQQGGAAALTLDSVLTWSLSQNEDITVDQTVALMKPSVRFYCLKALLFDLTNAFKRVVQPYRRFLSQGSDNWNPPGVTVTAVHPCYTHNTD